MENSHAPLNSPPYPTASFFVGALKATLREDGTITPESWQQCIELAQEYASERLVREDEIRWNSVDKDVESTARDI